MRKQNGKSKVLSVRFERGYASSDQRWSQDCWIYKFLESIKSFKTISLDFSPKTSSTDLSLIKRYGRRCGIVVLGAWGFEQSFILFNVGLSFASKLKALSVYFCLRVCHVVSSFWICKKLKKNKQQFDKIKRCQGTHLRHAQPQHNRTESEKISSSCFGVDSDLNPFI